MRALVPTLRVIALAAPLAGCGPVDDDLPGATRVAVTNVPDGVACLRFSVQPAGAPTTVLDRGVSVGGAAVVSLGALPGGAVAIAAGAFPAACASVTPTAVPTWVAAAQFYEIRAGYRNEVALTFRPNVGVSVGGTFITPARAIALGARTAYALLEDGTVRAWGSNAAGALGDGSAVAEARLPVALALRDVVSVSAAGDHACALTRDGQAHCWGANANGQLGTGDTSPRSTPTPVHSGGVRFRQLDAGVRHTCGVSTGDAVGCWGRRAAVGGTGADQLTPAFSVFGASGSVIDLNAGGDATCVRGADSQLVCVGPNATGEIGVGRFGAVTSYTATRFPIAAGFDVGTRHSCVVTLAGGLSCAGSASNGQLGNAVRGNYFETVPVAASLTGVAAVTVGGRFTCALRTDTTVWCWGNGSVGQIGSAQAAGAANVLTPQRATGLVDVLQVVAGEESACALRRDGSVWCWGNNDGGQIGDGTGAVRYTPVQVTL